MDRPPAIHHRDSGRLPEPCWTLAEAAEFFAKGSLPLDARALRYIIFELRRNSGGVHWQPAGRRNPAAAPADRAGDGTGGKWDETAGDFRNAGGPPAPVYPAADLMHLHSALATWLTRPGE